MASCEFREQIGGTVPINLQPTAFLAIEAPSLYLADVEAPDAGKNVWFASRSLNTKGQPDPWSQI